MEIQIHQRDPQIQIEESDYRLLIQNVSNEIGLDAESCAFIFVDDKALSKMHAEYLDDPSETDVITFNLGDNKIEGEIYISCNQARVQAKEFGVTAEEEVARLIIHGLLHLKGYNDIKDEERAIMKKLENKLLSQLFPINKKK